MATAIKPIEHFKKFSFRFILYASQTRLAGIEDKWNEPFCRCFVNELVDALVLCESLREDASGNYPDQSPCWSAPARVNEHLKEPVKSIPAARLGLENIRRGVGLIKEFNDIIKRQEFVL